MPDKIILNTIEYRGFRGLLAILKLMPAGIAKRLLVSLFVAVGYGIGIRRKIAEKQLHKVLPDIGSSERKRILKALYAEMGKSTYEMFLMSDEELFSHSRIIGREYVDQALDMGRGAILATAHFGNWEAARVLPMAGIPLGVVTKQMRNNLFDDYTNRIRKGKGLVVLDMKRGLRDLIHYLNKGYFIAILMDQDAGNTGVIVDFLGYPASHWLGVAKLSLRYKVPIVPGFARRMDDDSIAFEFFPPILNESLEDNEDNHIKVLGEVNRIIEQQIRKYPEQWFWVHKRWKHVCDMF